MRDHRVSSPPRISMGASVKLSTVLMWLGAAIGGLWLALILGLAIIQWDANALRGPIARIVSAKPNRAVHLDGRLSLDLLSIKPHTLVRGLRVANPSWAGATDLVRIGQMQIWVSLPALLAKPMTRVPSGNNPSPSSTFTGAKLLL